MQLAHIATHGIGLNAPKALVLRTCSTALSGATNMAHATAQPIAGTTCRKRMLSAGIVCLSAAAATPLLPRRSA
jgi:hypothetical protein